MRKNLIVMLLLLTALAVKAQTNNKDAKTDTLAVSNASDEELEPVDEPAEYPGGMEAFLTYISRKLKYPEQARLDRIAGKVLVSFIVETSGSLGEVKIIKSLTKETDAEAIRLIKASKTWKPAKIAGKPARQRFKQTITFSPPES